MPVIKSRIPISSGTGLPALTISDEEWKRGEAALKHNISVDVREKINESTRIHMSNTRMAEGLGSCSIYSSVAIKQIEEIKKTATAYHDAIMKSGNLFARHLIAVQLQGDSRIKVKLDQELAMRPEECFQNSRVYPDGMPVLQDVNGDLVTDSDGNPVPDMKTIEAIGFKFDAAAASPDQNGLMPAPLPSSGVSDSPGPQQSVDQSAPAVSEPAEATAPNYRPYVAALRSMALEAHVVASACNDALRVPQLIAADRSLMQDEMERGVTLTAEEALERVANHNILHVLSVGFSQKEMWSLWICDLVAIFEAAELPTAVRGDTDKNKSGQQSAFVDFMKWLRERIPEECRRYPRHNSSDDNLARAIIEAKRVSFREPKDP